VTGGQASIEREPRAYVLLVEDNPADANLVQEALFEAQINRGIQIVVDGSKAIDLINSIESGAMDCPDLIMLDLNLPRTSGEEVLKRVRASRRCGGVKVIIITSSNAPQDRQRAMELGATAYFRKPSTLEEFLELGPRVRRLLESQG
jgi:CheY-like chemotaxis protein